MYIVNSVIESSLRGKLQVVIYVYSEFCYGRGLKFINASIEPHYFFHAILL